MLETDLFLNKIGLKSLVIYLNPSKTYLFFILLILSSNISNFNLTCFLFYSAASFAALIAAYSAATLSLSFLAAISAANLAEAASSSAFFFFSSSSFAFLSRSFSSSSFIFYYAVPKSRTFLVSLLSEERSYFAPKRGVVGIFGLIIEMGDGGLRTIDAFLELRADVYMI